MKLLWLTFFRLELCPLIGGAASLSLEASLLFAYLVLLIASGSFDCFLRGNLKLRSFDLANFSSISFLKSMSSVSILGLIYLGFVSGPHAKAIMFPYEVLASIVVEPAAFPFCLFSIYH